MERDIILIIEGGAMSGIFGAGVVSALEHRDIYNKIESVYSVSAGSQTAAYFLSKTTIKGTELYTKELLSKRKKFLSLNIFSIIKKIWDLIFLKKCLDLMDLEVLKLIQKTKSKVDFRKIKNSPINFYVRVFDYKNLDIKYMNGKKNTIEIINISSNMPPYMHIKTRYKFLYDGCTVPNDSFLDIVKQNPEKKIIWVLNEKRTIWSSTKDLPFRVIDFLIKSLYLGLDYMTYHVIHFFDNPTIERLRLYKNVEIIYPDYNVRKFSKNRKRLLKLYYHGIEKGEQFLKKIKVELKHKIGVNE